MFKDKHSSSNNTYLNNIKQYKSNNNFSQGYFNKILILRNQVIRLYF